MDVYAASKAHQGISVVLHAKALQNQDENIKRKTELLIKIL